MKGKGKPEDLDVLLGAARNMEGKTICVFADAAAWITVVPAGTSISFPSIVNLGIGSTVHPEPVEGCPWSDSLRSW